jgi:formamidopyrimidine-DNA glycosylase
MPELPDLEVFAENLEKRFKNKTLEKVTVTVTRKLNVPEKEVITALEGHKLLSVNREGKTVQLHFGGGAVLGLHLMLHGELVLLDGETTAKHQVIAFYFRGNEGFALTDFQKAATPTLNPVFSAVPDALSSQMNLEYLEKILSGKRAPVKSVLMDQKLIRGIGNTYADEILWMAKISPMSVSQAIPKDKVKILLGAIHEVLKQEIVQIRSLLSDNLGGEIRDFLKIHGAKIKQSPTGDKILVGEIGGRKTYYTKEQTLYQ